MTRNIDSTLNSMVQHLLTIEHLRTNGHDSLQVTLNHIYSNVVEVITMVGQVNSTTNTEVGQAEWYALLRDTRDLAAQVEAQVKAVEALNDALTLSA